MNVKGSVIPTSYYQRVFAAFTGTLGVITPLVAGTTTFTEVTEAGAATEAGTTTDLTAAGAAADVIAAGETVKTLPADAGFAADATPLPRETGLALLAAVAAAAGTTGATGFEILFLPLASPTGTS